MAQQELLFACWAIFHADFFSKLTFQKKNLSTWNGLNPDQTDILSVLI